MNNERDLPPALADMDVELSVRLGSAELSLREVAALKSGSVITLRESAERPLELLANGQVIARGALEEAEGGDGLLLRIAETISN